MVHWGPMVACAPMCSPEKDTPMFDFSLSPELIDLRDRTLAFVRDEVIPQERFVAEHEGLPAERLEALRQKARDAGLYAPHVEKSGAAWGWICGR